jgi:hypothetical protein
MNSLRCDFNLPWRGAIIGAMFYVGLSLFMAHFFNLFNFFECNVRNSGALYDNAPYNFPPRA